jgi:NAD(P)-dependent dehydrogenase (short-subunit alcohol dehydrogenase family)
LGGGAVSPFPNYSAYACAKAALVRLTETLAVELAPRGIAINALAPGFIATKTPEITMASGPQRSGSRGSSSPNAWPPWRRTVLSLSGAAIMF